LNSYFQIRLHVYDYYKLKITSDLGEGVTILISIFIFVVSIWFLNNIRKNYIKNLCSLIQIQSQGISGTVDDKINLDVHAINDLQTKGFPPTDDSPKYKYSDDENGNYSEYLIMSKPFSKLDFFPLIYRYSVIFWNKKSIQCVVLVRDK